MSDNISRISKAASKLGAARAGMVMALVLTPALTGWGCQPSGEANRTGVTSTGGMGQGGAGGALIDAGTGGAPQDADSDVIDTAPGTGGMGTGGMGTGGSGTGGSGTGGSGTGGAPGTGGTTPVDMAPEVPEVRLALLVVLDPAMLTVGEAKLKMLLEGRGFTVTLAADTASAAGATGKTLVVISSTVGSNTLLAKYKDVAVPVLDLEASVFDDMKMTGPTKTTDYDEDQANEIVVLTGMQVHPLAANLTGRVTVSSGGPNECCGTNWGKPAASAVAIASWGPTVSANKIAIFGYDRGARMVDGFVAPARRVGLFAADTTAQWLTPNGVMLVNAAIEWAIASD